MPIVAENCKKCNAPIYFENDCDTAVCQFCGTQNRKEEAVIQNYQTNNFSGANVVINDVNAVENQLNNAETYLTKLKDFDKAEKIYSDLVQKASGEYRCWWGLVRVMSHDFSILPEEKYYDQYYNEMFQYATNAYNVTEDKAVKKKIKSEWHQYNEFIAKNKEEQLNQCNKSYEDLSNIIKNNNKKIDELQTKKSKNLNMIKLLEERVEKGVHRDYVFTFISMIICIFIVILILIAVTAVNKILPVTISVLLGILLIFYLWIKESNVKNNSIRKQRITDLEEEIKNCEDTVDKLTADISLNNNKVEDVESSIKYYNEFFTKEID